MTTRSRWMGLLLAGLCGCGGISEQRISSLEAEVNALRDRQASGGDASAGLKLEMDKRLGELQQAQKTLEDKVAALGQGVNQAPSAPAPAPAPGAPAPAAEVATPGDPWLLASEALGAPVEPQVKLDGDTFKVGREWLIEELRQAVAQKQVPKVAVDKKAGGVSLKAVKPKSLAEQLGFKSNDVILEVAGRATPSPAELVAALKGAGSPVKVKLQRKGAEIVQSYSLVD